MREGRQDTDDPVRAVVHLKHGPHHARILAVVPHPVVVAQKENRFGVESVLPGKKGAAEMGLDFENGETIGRDNTRLDPLRLVILTARRMNGML